jgi:hypothetical protein
MPALQLQNDSPTNLLIGVSQLRYNWHLTKPAVDPLRYSPRGLIHPTLYVEESAFDVYGF